MNYRVSRPAARTPVGSLSFDARDPGSHDRKEIIILTVAWIGTREFFENCQSLAVGLQGVVPPATFAEHHSNAFVRVSKIPASFHVVRIGIGELLKTLQSFVKIAHRAGKIAAAFPAAQADIQQTIRCRPGLPGMSRQEQTVHCVTLELDLEGLPVIGRATGLIAQSPQRIADAKVPGRQICSPFIFGALAGRLQNIYGLPGCGQSFLKSR